MATGITQHQMRLVGSPIAPGFAEWSDRQQQQNAVVKENRLAAHGRLVNADDPMLLLASRTRCELQGAVLTPERRGKLLKLANRIGVRPFDASLVIAIEQDRARRGAEHEPLPQRADDSDWELRPSSARERFWFRWLIAGLVAVTVAIVLIRWLVMT